MQRLQDMLPLNMSKQVGETHFYKKSEQGKCGTLNQDQKSETDLSFHTYEAYVHKHMFQSKDVSLSVSCNPCCISPHACGCRYTRLKCKSSQQRQTLLERTDVRWLPGTSLTAVTLTWLYMVSGPIASLFVA